LAAPFAAFESGPVRPLALSPDRTRLFATNIPDNQLEIFSIGGDGSLTHTASVPVGLEPVAVAARSNGEVWVVNHLSDSISIVDVASVPPRVLRTLLVGDEPRDIVFAGNGNQRAFITTAHRGQNHPNDPQLTTPGVGRADVWVFDAQNPGNGLGGTPLTILSLFGDTPRALAVSPDRSTVYAAVFHSGNRTTAINDGLVCDGGANASPCQVLGNQLPGGLPPPNANVQHIPQPEVGLIVKFHAPSGEWRDELGRSWNNAVRFSLPDYDVFAIDADADPPTQTAAHSGVGTILFNMAVNPVTGKIYVSNTEAHNEVRFEGRGTPLRSSVRGRLHESRITVIAGNSVLPRHLNKHINYAAPVAPIAVRKKSLATPLDMAISADGATLYVAAFGSDKVGIFKTAELETDSFVPSASRQIAIPGGGPSGLALSETHKRLYVLTRFDNGISVVDTAKRKEVQHVTLHNPEPFSVIDGRRFLYDANLTSSNGEASCASCHVFGDLDDLAWDLGNPDDIVLNNPNPFRVGPLGDASFHPMKGPMATQTLRGMAAHGPMHWRGDRTGGNDLGGDALNESQAFMKFNGAFDALLGRSKLLSDADMQRFTDFMLQVVPPPNPIRNLDNSLTPLQDAGRNFYFNAPVDASVLTCNDCHTLNPSQGFFGADGLSSFENETQHFKIAPLRNAYTKVGMFGFAGTLALPGGGNPTTGDQIRGYGYLHDGSVDTIFRFLTATVFNFPGGDPDRLAVESFLFAFDSNLAPAVGQQITLDAGNALQVGPRIDLLRNRAAAGDCDLIVKGRLGGEARGWYQTAMGGFQPDRSAEGAISDASLRALALAAAEPLTYTCVPPGSGVRIGVDRDGDSVFDGDERDAGTDPGDPTSLPSYAVSCSAGITIAKPRLRITKNLLPAGDEAITLSGEFTVASTAAPINPIAYGIRFRVNDSSGQPLFNRVVPRGAPIGAGRPGWTVNRAGTTWTYRDAKGSNAAGITRVVVQHRTPATTPGRYSVSITGKGSNFRVDPGSLPLQMLVILGGADQAALGQCASLSFQPAPAPSPSCSVASSGATVLCK
jgi:6-phosphogluconolactonase (cycloisomerase 2 family)